MLRKDPLGVRTLCPAGRPTEDGCNEDAPTFAVALDGRAHRAGVKYKLVMLSTKRAAKPGHCKANVGEKVREVLKCTDGMGTLPCPVLGARVFQRPAKEVKTPAPCSFQLCPYPEAGKLPWRRMLRYPGKLGKKEEKQQGGEHQSHAFPQQGAGIVNWTSPIAAAPAPFLQNMR